MTATQMFHKNLVSLLRKLTRQIKAKRRLK
jgi:hypothetical protein